MVAPAIAAPRDSVKVRDVNYSQVKVPIVNAVEIVNRFLKLTSLLVVLGILFGGSAEAESGYQTAENPYALLLDDPFPSADSPYDLSPNHFRWRGDTLPAGLKVEWIPSSVQWSRIKGRIVLPRAGVLVRVSRR